MRILFGVAGLIASLVLTSGPAYAQGKALELKESGDEAGVGANATGEPCKIRLLRSQRWGLFCEGWRVQSGELRRSRQEPDVTAESLLAEDAWPREWIARLGDCRPAEATTFLGSGRAALRECKRADGGWPMVIAAARVGARAYIAEALPANLRVIERAGLLLEGKAAAAASSGSGTLSAAIRRAETLHGASGKLIGVQDLGAFEDLRELGKRYHRSADYASAEITQRRVLEIHERMVGVGNPAAALIVADIAGDLSKQGQFAEADQMFVRAGALGQNASRPEVLTSVLAYHSVHETLKGNYQEAARLARLAVPVKDERKGRPTVRLGHAQYALALASYFLHDWPGAADAAEDALVTFAAPGRYSEARLWWEGETHELAGRIYREQRRYAESRAAFERARERRWVMYGDTPRVARSFTEIGLSYRAEGNLTAALDSYRRAATMLARDRRGRETVRALGVAAHLDALATAMEGASATERAALSAEAFTVAQIPRASESSQALQAMATRVAQGDPVIAAAARDLQDGTRRRDAARAALAQEQLNPPEERDADRENELKAAYRKAEEEVDRLEERIQATFPRYAQLMAEAPVPADDLRALLRPGEALLLLLPSPEQTYVLLVRDGTVHLHRAAVGAAALATRVAALRPRAEAGSALAAFDVNAAHALYRDLLGPLGTRLEGARHLLVVTSGPLLSLPLGVLVTKPPAAGAADDYRHAAWLAREVAISVLPSVSAVRDLRKVAGTSSAPKPFIGFGDPAFAGAPGDLRAVAAASDHCRRDGAGDAALVRALPRLPDTARELGDIARALGAGTESVVLGARATEAAVRAATLDQYRVVAFATHGLLPGELKCKSEPALALTPPAGPPAPGSSDDGLLVVSEIAMLRLDADWVVLSACNTGAGGRLGGDSLSGLARGFLYAGARGLLVSHWAVASRPTVRLTTGAFAALAREPGIGRAEALRRSQLVLAGEADTAHPFFWAPFVLVGDGGSASR